MNDQRQRLGDLGEEVAVNYLKKKGYKILKRQFKSKFGEIDIIVSKGESLVLVEVKTRKSNEFGVPEEAVNERKLEKIIATGNCYQEKLKGKYEEIQVDVISIIVASDMKVQELKHLTNVWL